MPKPESIFRDINNRFTGVQEKYKRLENLYHKRVGAIAKMDLDREHAAERFCLNAIFGWRP